MLIDNSMLRVGIELRHNFEALNFTFEVTVKVDSFTLGTFLAMWELPVK